MYNKQIIDLTFAQFLERHENFKVDQFTVPLLFWMSLNELKKDEWFKLTDDIIDLIGYKSSVSNNNQKSLLRFIRKNFKEGIDFREVHVATLNNARGGAHYKIEIEMKKFPFKKMLMKVGTEMSDAIHDYLIAFEELTIEYMTYQYHSKSIEVRRMNTILEEKEEELRMYTYEPVDSSLGRIMAFRPDTVFLSMVTLSPRSKKLRRQQLRYEAEQDYFAISKAEQLVKKYDRENGLCDSDSNNSDDEY